MIFLPNAGTVDIDPRKIIYLLTTAKAGFFTAHGFDISRPKELDAALRQHPINNPIEGVFATVHGFKFTVRCSLPSPDGRNPCAFTAWIFDPGTITARFVTGYASPLPSSATQQIAAGAPTHP